jgi:hypothetical protein
VSASALLFTAGCGATGAAAPPSAPVDAVDPGAAPPPPRRPDGVVLEPEALVPAAAARAPARGVIALREPAGADAVVELVRGLFDGWSRQSLDAMLAFTTSDAGLLDGSDHGHAALVESWRQRLHAHEYNRLAGSEIVRPERIERWDWDELGTPPNPSRPSGMHAGEVLVRVPIEVTSIAGERVFGDMLTLVLKRQEGRLRIAAYGESEGP